MAPASASSNDGRRQQSNRGSLSWLPIFLSAFGSFVVTLSVLQQAERVAVVPRPTTESPSSHTSGLVAGDVGTFSEVAELSILLAYQQRQQQREREESSSSQKTYSAVNPTRKSPPRRRRVFPPRFFTLAHPDRRKWHHYVRKELLCFCLSCLTHAQFPAVSSFHGN